MLMLETGCQRDLSPTQTAEPPPAKTLADPEKRFDPLFPIPSNAKIDRRDVKWGCISADGQEQCPPKHLLASSYLKNEYPLQRQAATVGQPGVLLISSGEWQYFNKSESLTTKPLTSDVVHVVNFGESLFGVTRREHPRDRSISDIHWSIHAPLDCHLVYDPYGMWDPAEGVTPHSYFSEGLILVAQDGKYGYADRYGEIQIPPTFQAGRMFHEGQAAVMVDGLWGFINTQGETVVEPQFSSVYAFDDGKALVHQDEPDAEQHTYFFLDAEGEKLPFIPRQLPLPYHHDMSRLSDGQVGFVDIDGEWAIEAAFITASDFHESGAFVVSENREESGFIDTEGNLVLSLPGLVDATYFQSGLAWVTLDDGTAGYIDRNGEWVWQVASAE